MKAELFFFRFFFKEIRTNKNQTVSCILLLVDVTVTQKIITMHDMVPNYILPYYICSLLYVYSTLQSISSVNHQY